MSIVTPLEGFGGGSSLNFKVVGNPQPASPKENTIWLDTDAEITGWTFRADDPHLYESDNLYVLAENAGYINSSNSIGSDVNWRYTSHIELPDSAQSIKLTMGTVSSNAPCHAFYDADKNLISTFFRQTGANNYNVPSNAKYIRLSVYYNSGACEAVTLIASYTEGPEGMVWFPTGTSSPVEFNALKKNGIQVYPISAKQYVGGAWVDVTAKTYQNGVWVDWFTYIVKDGVITSKFDLSGLLRSITKYTLTQESDCLRFRDTYGETNGFAPSAGVDVSNISKFVLVCKIINPGTSGCGIGLSKALNASSYDSCLSNIVAREMRTAAGDYTLELNVETYSGLYYPCIWAQGGSAAKPDMYVYDFYYV